MQSIVIDIDGIDGDCQLDGYEGWHYVQSVNYGASQTGAKQNVRGSNRSRVSVTDVIVTKVVDEATPSLFAALFRNTLHSKISIHFLEQTGDKHHSYFEITLRDVVVANLNVQGNEGRVRPTAEATLSYRKINMLFNSKDKTGTRIGTSESEFDVGVNQVG